MKVGGVVLGMLFLVAMGILVIGALLPRDHKVARALSLKRTPPEVFAVISNVADAAAWRPNVKSVTLVSPGGPLTYREVSNDGAITYEVMESVPPRRFVTRIADVGLPFGGTWTITLDPSAGGTRMTIQEDGEVRNILFRFMSRYVFGHARSIDTYLTALAVKFGETPRIESPP